ncbi:MAG TPA: FtsX-like permease family protein [Terriglobia bacterium]|nr:FtsX-like permease family protein [Terriglobia bacterium]
MVQPKRGSQRSLFWRLWLRALTVRRPQTAVAIMSLIVGAAMISMLVNLWSGVRRGMTEEFRAYGANVVVAPVTGASSGASPTAAPVPLMNISELGPVEDYARRETGLVVVPRLDVVAQVEKAPGAQSTAGSPASASAVTSVVAVGADFAALLRLNPGWRLLGPTRSLEGSACTVGQRVASRLGLSIGDDIGIEARASSASRWSPEPAFRVANIVSTGASEDDQVFVPLAALQHLAVAEGRISLVELSVPGGPREVEHTTRALEAGLARTGSGAEVRPIRQIAESEGQVLGTIRALVIWLTILILVIIALSVIANMTAIVLERRKDVAVMKALGAGDRLVMRLFLAEGAALGLAAGLIGVLGGALVARALGLRLFGVALGLTWWTLPAVCVASMTLATLATFLPVRIVRGVEPALVLKGE